jgi:hypothetical protein
MAREFFYSICAILDMPLLDGVWGDADEGSGLWEGVAASERGEGRVRRQGVSIPRAVFVRV